MPADEQRKERLLATGFGGSYVPDTEDTGHILYVREGTLWAMPFEPDRLALTGEPVRVAGPIGSFRDGAFFSATSSVLVYRGGAPDFQVA